MQDKPVRDLTVAGDFIRYFIMLLIPFFIIGGIWGFIHDSFLVCGIGYPLLYSFGIGLIILLINNDINRILSVFGLGSETGQSLSGKHGKAIQNISYLVGMKKFDEALKAVNTLLREEPGFTHALNIKGQILLEGFSKYAEARRCFEKVLKLAKPEDEQYKLADSLCVECHNLEENN